MGTVKCAAGHDDGAVPGEVVGLPAAQSIRRHSMTSTHYGECRISGRSRVARAQGEAMTTVEVRDDGPALRAMLRLPGCSPDHALQAFTAPDLLARWWANAELTADLTPGGHYDVWFAGIPARMTGRVVRYDPGSVLVFSWGWEHEPELPPSSVAVEVGAAEDGTTTLRIEHGPHAEDEAGRAARAQHREGWEHFLPRLAALLTG
jgi:uncharacterized protein YndB with AHSA1/START domain